VVLSSLMLHHLPDDLRPGAIAEMLCVLLALIGLGRHLGLGLMVGLGILAGGLALHVLAALFGRRWLRRRRQAASSSNRPPSTLPVLMSTQDCCRRSSRRHARCCASRWLPSWVCWSTCS
jgi:hypothetical protein